MQEIASFANQGLRVTILGDGRITITYDAPLAKRKTKVVVSFDANGNVTTETKPP